MDDRQALAYGLMFFMVLMLALALTAGVMLRRRMRRTRHRRHVRINLIRE